MTGQLFELVISAVGEVRDGDGNLVSTEPIQGRMQVTAEQLAELGLTPTDEGNNS